MTVISQATSTSTTTSVSVATSSSQLPKGGTFALINTSQGPITVQLFPSSAPKTVSNFESLATSGFYNNLVWHRIVSGFVIQTGDPNTRSGGGDRSTWGTGTSGTSIPFEYAPSLHNTAGSIAMASTGAGVGGSSQFYINLVDNSQSLDGKYAVFGQVISGMNVVQSLGNSPVNSNSQPINPSAAMVISITVIQT